MTSPLKKVRATIGIVRQSPWLIVDQAMIDRFADATSDHQYIHVDPVRAAATPFGRTIAHGLLTLSLLPQMLQSLGDAPLAGIGMTVNYGFDRVRFVHPVRSGSHIRATFTLTSVDEKRPGQAQQSHDVVVEVEGEDRPALTAVWLTQFFF